MERRNQSDERRKALGTQLRDERRVKSRRKARKFVGTPPSDEVCIDELEDLKYWSKELGTTEAELRSAVQQVGPKVKALRAHLRK